VSNDIRAIMVTSGGGVVASCSPPLVRYSFEVTADDQLSVAHPSKLYPRKKLDQTPRAAGLF
jgi:hypothetical protein